MYVLVNMEYDGDEHSMKVVGTYDTWESAQAAMYEDVEHYVKECEWEDGQWEVLNRQAYAIPQAYALDQDGCDVDPDARSYWAIFDTTKELRWCSWMIDTNYWALDNRR